MPSTTRRIRHSRPPIGLCLALLCITLAACQTTAQRTRPVDSDDVDRSVSLPATFENVWYRQAIQPAHGIPFAATGTLLVGDDTITYQHGSGSVSIRVADVRGIVWRTMQGDLQNEWAVVRYLEGGSEKLIGFAAADRFRFDTSNKQLYSALVVAWESQSRR